MITGSFKIAGRGIVAMGDIIEGRVKVGNFTTFTTGIRDVTLRIGGVSMGGSASSRDYFVGLTFVYKDQEERMEFESIKLKEQVIEIKEE
jgi:hypothetical protein